MATGFCIAVDWGTSTLRAWLLRADGHVLAESRSDEGADGLTAAAFRDRLIDGYLVSQPEPPSPRAILRAVGMLEARARFKADIPDVFIRTGRDGDGECGRANQQARCHT